MIGGRRWNGASSLDDDRQENTGRGNEDCARVEATEGTRATDFQSVIDSIPALIAMMTPDGVLESANRHTLEYLGATLEELKEWTTSDTVHPADLPAVLAAWMQAVDTGEPYDIEHRIRRADGSYHWFHVRGLPLRDAEGRITRWCVVETDVEDRKRAAALLAGEKRLLEMVVRGRPQLEILKALCEFAEDTIASCRCGIALIDARHGRFSHSAAPSLPDDFMQPDAQPVGRGDASPEATAAVFDSEVISLDLRLETRWPAWRAEALAHGIRTVLATPISSASGEVMGVLSLFGDQATGLAPDRNLLARFTYLAGISIERARGEATLKQSEAFLAKGQRLSSTGTFAWRVATDEILWSEEIYRIYGLDPAIPVTFELIDMRLHPDDVPSHHEMRRQQRAAATDFEHEHRILMPDGTMKYLHLDTHATWDENGQLEYIGAVQDVTERRLSEEALGRVRSELAQLARVTTLGALTASIAHEVNQPLAGIITNANTCLRMLAADPPNVDGARETARRTIRDGNRASDVIKRLRALFAKRDATVESLNLNEAAREVIAMVLDEIQKRGILLQPELTQDLPAVVGDRVQLQQVILNLVSNASDATSEVAGRPRKIVISTGRDGNDHVRLAVRDTGTGFAPEDADKLFTAFYTTKREGMGIGLSISRSIIESHYGRLWATPNDGPGSTFAFSIPCLSGVAADACNSSAVRPDVTIDQDHTVETS